MSLVLLAIPVLLLLATVTGALAGPRRADLAGRATVLAAALGFLLAVLLLVAILADGPVEAVLGSGVGLFADRVGTVLLLLVTGLGTVVTSFARRYLQGDARASWLFACTAALLSATCCLVTASTLVGLALAWTLAGVSLVLLLATYRELPAARTGVARTALALGIGDLALWAAVVIAARQWGNLDLRRLDETAPGLTGDTGTLTAFAVLVVVAALARSAQLPFVDWLPATLAAPTPVSALLHAGVVNAGGVLLVTTSPLFGASATATHLAFAAGALTAVYGTVLMLAKPDVKGSLAASTTGQMGFMIMTCGLGAFAAAIFHLVAHGMYKATLFLGSGSAVRHLVRHRAAPPAPAGALSGGLVALALAVPALALTAAAVLLHPDVGGGRGTGALLVFAWASGALGLLGWLRRAPGTRTALLGAALSVGAAFGYLALLRGVADLLAPDLTGAGTATASAWWLLPVVLAIAAATIVRLRPGRAHQALYAFALSRGAVRPTRRRGAATATRHPVVVLPALAQEPVA